MEQYRRTSPGNNYTYYSSLIYALWQLPYYRKNIPLMDLGRNRVIVRILILTINNDKQTFRFSKVWRLL